MFASYQSRISLFQGSNWSYGMCPVSSSRSIALRALSTHGSNRVTVACRGRASVAISITNMLQKNSYSPQQFPNGGRSARCIPSKIAPPCARAQAGTAMIINRPLTKILGQEVELVEAHGGSEAAKRTRQKCALPLRVSHQAAVGCQHHPS